MCLYVLGFKMYITIQKEKHQYEPLTSLHEQVEEEGIDEEEKICEELYANFRVYVEVFDEVQCLCKDVQYAGNFTSDLHLPIL